MPKVTYLHADGTEDVVDAQDGVSVMRTAVTKGVKGIVGECGGELMCATCHVYVLKPVNLASERSEDEDEMLEFAASPRRDNSRLSCQIIMDEPLDGLVVETPEAQN
ncbi:MAG: 2Fe-2S ferredoxin [Microbacteriaceae bacterium]|nr:2Fe-2S ferredoxin [Microbacteriaceae bacterium]